MQVSNIIAEIDAEIQRLTHARQALVSIGTVKEVKRPGRPKGSKNATTATPAVAVKKRKMTPEGRKRIADAMKKRWEETRKKQAAK